MKRSILRIILIKPSMGPIIEGYSINDGRMEPLSLGIIAALTPADIEVSLYDDRMEAIPFEQPADLVAISVDTFTAARAYQISARFRERGVPVILGGIHVTLLPDEAASHADSIFTGDAEHGWGEVIADLRQGRLKPRYTSGFGVPQQDIIPRRELFKGKGYLPISLVQFSRGCQYNCSYCAVSRYFQQTHYCRSSRAVIHEIEAGGLKQILFVDDNMVCNRQHLKEFLKELIPLKIKWASQASIDMVRDPELMELMAASGCVGNLIGFEAISPDNLKWFNKSPNLQQFDTYQKALEVLRDYGFQTWASFILGNDFDTPETVKQTVKFAIENKFALAFFHIFSPYPGTALYRQLETEQRLLLDGKWWLHGDYRYNQAAFIPRHFTPEELSREVVQANKEFFTWNSIMKRALDRKTNLRSLQKFLIYAQFNLIMRKTST